MERIKLLVFIVIFIQYAEANGYFTVIGSDSLRLNKSYAVSVNYEDYNEEYSLNIELAGGENYREKQQVKFIGTGSKIIEFKRIDEPAQEYVLKVTGDNFESSTKLTLIAKQCSVFVQTDKAIYKPADKIQFRVLILDSETRPFTASSVEIFITDGADNRIKQYDKVIEKMVKGVYRNELQLSDSPVLGKWKINVIVNGEKVLKSFEVAEYVLPKFEFKLDPNPHANFENGKLIIKLSAKYTFGKNARGDVMVTVLEDRRGYSRKRIIHDSEIDGEKLVELKLQEILRLDVAREKVLNFFATFVEKMTGKKQTATAQVKVHKTPYKIDVEKSGENFKPGLPFYITAFVRYHDKNAPVIDKLKPVRVVINYFSNLEKNCTCNYYKPQYPIGWRVNDTTIQSSSANSNRRSQNAWTPRSSPSRQQWVPRPSYPRNGRCDGTSDTYVCQEQYYFVETKEIYLENGIANVEIEVPSNTTKINAEIRYKGTYTVVHGITRQETESNQYIQAKLLTEKPSLKAEVVVEVLSTEDLSQISYQVIGPGNLAISSTVNFSKAKKFDIKFVPKREMYPKSNVIIFYITKSGEIISDRVEVKFENELLNHVDLHLSANETKPGDTLNITINSQQNAYIGLLGVDQSVMVLKKGNDLELSEVFEELNKYGTPSKQKRSERDYKDFSNSNSIIITNANKEYKGFQKIDSFPISNRIGWNSPRVPQGQSYAYTATESRASISKPKKEEPLEIRNVFPETWIFDDFELKSSEQILSKRVPDTITSWIITGFSISPNDGLALTRQPTKLNVFQPFFVSTNLPYSIKRGEVVAIPISVFNYLGSDIEVDVTLFNSDTEFHFVEVNENTVRRKRGLEAERKKKVHVKSNEGKLVSFMIRPLKAGYIKIKVTGVSELAGDGVERQLLVEPEGITKYDNKAVLVDLRDDENFITKIAISVPPNAVPDSVKIEASAIGDVMGPTLENLDKLIKLPYGCGEQNMVNFVPNIVVLDYLTNVNKLTPEVAEKAKNHLEIGYQKQLTYKHDDGSYSAFGKSDRSGSTWLTAFVAKSFNQASKYIDIEDKHVINDAMKFLSKVQSNDGSFPEVGHMLSKSMQGGSGKNGVALTAYVLIAFLEDTNHVNLYKNTIEKAISFIQQNLLDLDDYSLAIASYALQLAKESDRQVVLDKLNAKSINERGRKYWKKELPNVESKYNRKSSVNIEMTAYALLAFTEAGEDADAISIMKWLISQRNENGGFQSTQDTVVGLQALARVAIKISSEEKNVKFEIKNDSNDSKAKIKVNSANELILQMHVLPSNAREFEVTAKGSGLSLLQISYKYNIASSKQSPQFILKPRIESTSNKEFLHLTICTSFVPDGESEKSNMALMEVKLPSGFTFDSDSLPDLLSTEKVKKVEVKDSESLVVLYFDDISQKEICPEIKAYRTHSVAKQKQASIIIYDYYNSSRSARTFYDPPEISLCDICGDGNECADCEVADIKVV